MNRVISIAARAGKFLPYVLLAMAAHGQAQARELVLQGYRTPDGGITAKYQGDVIDPYFANRALIAAVDAGLDVSEATRGWIDWSLRHQRPDGTFNRHCRRGEAFAPCAPADADDSVLAVWMELLAKLTKARGGSLPQSWQASLAKAETYLEGLYDRDSGLYVISGAKPVSLFMDNVEVYAAFVALADGYAALRDSGNWKAWATRADQLAKNIVRAFWQPCDGRFRISSQIIPDYQFYPDEVAQVFPMFLDMPTPQPAVEQAFSKWAAANRTMWLHRAEIDYPWGIIAGVAAKAKDRHTLACWRKSALPLRHGAHWNVLEEAMLQVLEEEPEGDGGLSCGGIASESLAAAGDVAMERKPPLVPTGLKIANQAPGLVTLAWDQAPAEAGIAGYDIYRDGVWIDSSLSTKYTDATVAPGKIYHYTLKSFDQEERLSGESTPLQVRMEPLATVTVFYATEANKLSIRYWAFGTPESGAVEVAMENACPGYKKKTITFDRSGYLSAVFAGPNGNRGAGNPAPYVLGGGTWLISDGILTAENPCRDRIPPGSPARIVVGPVDPRSVSLGWSAAEDNVAVAGYRVYRNGLEIAETMGLAYTDSACLREAETYTYMVKAFDAAGNLSAVSAKIDVVIPGGHRKSQ